MILCLFCIILSTRSTKLCLGGVFFILSTLDICHYSPWPLAVFTWYHPTSPLCSMLSDHLCQCDECVKDSSDRTVFFDTHFHSYESRLQYSSESLFQGFSTQSHIRLSISSTPVPLTSFRFGFLRAPGVLLCPQ